MEGVERRLYGQGKVRMREAIATGMKCELPPPPVRLDLHATMMEEIRDLLADHVGHWDVCRSNHGGRERYDRSIPYEGVREEVRRNIRHVRRGLGRGLRG